MIPQTRIVLAGVLILISAASQAQITSTFDTDADGWTFLDGTAPITVNHNASNGNPGGYVSVTYSASTSTSESWFAPPKFLGSQVLRSLGMNLRFDLQQSIAGTTSFVNGDIRIEGSGTNLVYSLPAKPAVAPAWSTYSLKLDETQGWRINSTTGTLATRAQIIDALSGITSIEIRGTYITNASFTAGLDNVILEQRALVPAPAITSFAPTSGKPGTSVTINGSGFESTLSENEVYFGPVRATISSASSTQLVVTVPVGASYGSITVVNKTTGLLKRSDQPFTALFDGGGRIIPASFDPKVDILLDPTTGNDVNGLAVADLDGDGWNDVLTSEQVINSVSIFRNLGNGGDLTAGSFASKFSLSGGGNSPGLHTIDLDGDGKLDVIAGYGNGSVTYFATYRNTSTPGNLSFEPVELWAGNAYSGSVSNIVDVDGDGRMDLIGQHGSSSVFIDFWIAQNISTPGDIQFGSSVSYFTTTLDAGAGVGYGDLDNDGKSELLVSHNFGSSISILKNTSSAGTISFINLGVIATGQYNRTIQVADFNLDGKNDIAFKFNGTQDIRIRVNTNSGGVLALTDFDTEVVLISDIGNYGGMSIADINGDGKPDIIASDDGNIGIFENVYTSGPFNANAFVRAHMYQGVANSTYPTAPLARDLNGDSKPDLAVGITNSSQVRLSFYENRNVAAPVISLNTVSPLKGAVGSIVTITGDNFSTTPSENTVYFGAITAKVLTASKTLLTVEVPAGATYAPVSVTRNELTARYDLPFNVTFSPGRTFDNTSFAPPVSFTLTTADYDIDVGDLDNDGKPDVMAEAASLFGYAFKNIHTSGPITIASLIADDTTEVSATNLKLMDINDDGKLDIVSNAGIFQNTSVVGNINFANRVTSASGSGNVSWNDFNLDGKTDVFGTATSANLAVFENWSRPGAFIASGFTGTFGPQILVAKPGANGGTASADFDRDGFFDMAVTNPAQDNITVYRNSGAPRISASMFTATNFAALDNPGRIYSGDLDVDGKMDLLIYHGTGVNAATLSVYHNQSTPGNIAFNRVDLPIGANATVAWISDLDGDGKPEIIVTSETGNRFSIFKNIHTSGAISTASFAAPFNTTVTAPRGLTTGDINLDGKPEIIITRAAGLLVVYENLVSVATITVTQQPVNPNNVCEGSNYVFSTDAIGTSNITFQWQKLNVNTNLFENLVSNATYSGVTTKNLNITNATLAADGNYRCMINGDFATTVYCNTGTLTVNVKPADPVVTSAERCGAGSVTLSASGGAPGEFIWRTDPISGEPIQNENDPTYTTPLLSVTTTYYVAVANSSCESNLVPVTATINTLPDAPTVTPASTCGQGSIVITASGGTNGQYRWYDVPTGGIALAGEINSSFVTPALTSTTTYYVAINTGSCESTRTAAIATILSVPSKPSITSNEPINAGVVELCLKAITLSAPSGFTYTWSSGETTQQITNVQPGNYSVVVKDASGCSSIASDVIQVVANTTCVNSPPVITTTTVITTIGGFVTIDLSDFISDPDNNLDPASLQVVGNATQRGGKTTLSGFTLDIDYSGINFSGDDLFTIRICDQLNVCIEKQFAIEVIGDINVYNGISPNGDGKNDTWIIEYIDLFPDTQTNRVTLYNRWGDVVWEASNYDNTSVVFTGINKNGSELSTGSYFYKIEFEGGRETITGYLSLKR